MTNINQILSLISTMHSVIPISSHEVYSFSYKGFNLKLTVPTVSLDMIKHNVTQKLNVKMNLIILFQLFSIVLENSFDLIRYLDKAPCPTVKCIVHNDWVIQKEIYLEATGHNISTDEKQRTLITLFSWLSPFSLSPEYRPRAWNTQSWDCSSHLKQFNVYNPTKVCLEVCVLFDCISDQVGNFC